MTYETSSRPNLHIEPRVGGRFFEISGKEERLYAIVTRYEPAKRLWMEGAMSLGGCVFGTIKIELRARDHSTEVHLSHRMIGEVDDEALATYRGGWKLLLDKGLRSFIETGTEAWSAA